MLVISVALTVIIGTVLLLYGGRNIKTVPRLPGTGSSQNILTISSVKNCSVFYQITDVVGSSKTVMVQVLHISRIFYELFFELILVREKIWSSDLNINIICDSLHVNQESGY